MRNPVYSRLRICRNIFSSAVLGIKLWLEEDGDLNRDDPSYSSNSLFSSKLKIDTKCHHLLAITLCTIQQLEFFCIFVISNNKSFISQNLKAEGPLGRKFNFSVLRDLKFKAI